jgi:acyl-CoA thioesterase-1
MRVSDGNCGRSRRQGASRGYGPSRRIVNVALGVGLIAAMLPRAAFSQTSGRLVVLGDSLAAGYGLPAEEAFPARLQSALVAAGHAVEVINAGVSGDTTAGGLARLDWALGNPAPGFAIVELGANDALRGLDPARAYENLDRIIARLKQRSVKVLLAGMKAPRNLGRDYANAFDAIYPRLADKHRVPLYDFFLDGVAAVPALNQRDGIHPNARGVEIIVERILPHVTRLLAGS